MADGFTLIELLVTTSIIAVLIALLLPALRNSRAQAQAVSCASNMRQWAMAFYSYAIDNDGSLPWFADAYPCCGKSFWTEATAPYIGLTDREAETEAVRRSRECPAEENTYVGVHYGGFNNGPHPIAPINYESHGGRRFPPVKVHDIRNPPKWIMLLDTHGSYMYSPVGWKMTVDWDSDGILDSHGVILQTQFPYNGAKPRVHLDTSNIGTPDGHVERIDYKLFLDTDNGYWKDGIR